MSREVRTLWWCGQGLLIFLIAAILFGEIIVGVLLCTSNFLAAIYSQFIQEAQ